MKKPLFNRFILFFLILFCSSNTWAEETFSGRNLGILGGGSYLLWKYFKRLSKKSKTPKKAPLWPLEMEEKTDSRNTFSPKIKKLASPEPRRSEVVTRSSSLQTSPQKEMGGESMWVFEMDDGEEVPLHLEPTNPKKYNDSIKLPASQRNSENIKKQHLHQISSDNPRNSETKPLPANTITAPLIQKFKIILEKIENALQNNHHGNLMEDLHTFLKSNFDEEDAERFQGEAPLAIVLKEISSLSTEEEQENFLQILLSFREKEDFSSLMKILRIVFKNFPKQQEIIQENLIEALTEYGEKTKPPSKTKPKNPTSHEKSAELFRLETTLNDALKLSPFLLKQTSTKKTIDVIVEKIKKILPSIDHDLTNESIPVDFLDRNFDIAEISLSRIRPLEKLRKSLKTGDLMLSKIQERLKMIREHANKYPSFTLEEEFPFEKMAEHFRNHFTQYTDNEASPKNKTSSILKQIEEKASQKGASNWFEKKLLQYRIQEELQKKEDTDLVNTLFKEANEIDSWWKDRLGKRFS